MADNLVSARNEDDKLRQAAELVKGLPEHPDTVGDIQTILASIESLRVRLKDVTQSTRTQDENLKQRALKLVDLQRQLATPPPAPVPVPATPVQRASVPPAPSAVPIPRTVSPPVFAEPAYPIITYPTQPEAFRIGEQVEVFQGDGWKIAAIREFDNRGYKLEYQDGGWTPGEWALPLRLRPLGSNPGLNKTIQVGTRLKVLHKFQDGTWSSQKAIVMSVEGNSLSVRCEGTGLLAHGEHYVKSPSRPMESSVTSVLP